MGPGTSIADGDRELIRAVDAALEAGAERSGRWLRCGPGCCECCMGPFEITQLDALRLQQGLEVLGRTDPERRSRVLERARVVWKRMAPAYPGDAAAGLLTASEEEQEKFFRNFEQEPCPALDPETKTCDLYVWRPITCRAFGPPARSGDFDFAVCELCFQGASDEEIRAAVVEIDPDGLEIKLIERLAAERGKEGMTVVAFALAGEPAT